MALVLQLFILAFGLLIVSAGFVMLFRPGSFLDVVQRYKGHPMLQVLAAAMRLALGVALILYGDQSRFPLFLQVVGCLSFATAIYVAILPRATFTDLVTWAVDRLAPWVRVAAPIVTLFGGFLVYAVT